ncbi:MAG: cytochrome-c oxidase, cbb3-type subunit III [Kistimonas sp.]|nr:cytochrome-c oxidase, cbb3-type subunit III [Kistimonas sp.]
MSGFWSGWVLLLTLGCLAFILVPLLVMWKVQRKHETEETVGHNFDGIEEYDNPMPTWWIGLYLAMFVFGFAYLALYPGLWPGYFDGLLGWTSDKQLASAQLRHTRQFQPLFDQYEAMTIEELQAHSKALSMGKRVFLNNCSQCHGSDAGGNFGFPRLTDNRWIWGGTPEDIKTTVMEGRQGQMPAWGPVIGEQRVRNVSSWVRSLSGLDIAATQEQLEDGREVFESTCSICHGKDAKGNTQVGAPNLTDGVWLYGNTQAQVEYTIRNGRNGVMPAWKEILGPEKVHLVSAYIYSLSHKKQKM